MSVNNNHKHLIYLNILKIIACFLVISNHTIGMVFTRTTPISKSWFISISYFCFSKIAVPVFIMVTGALLLCKIDSYKKWLERISRAIIILLIFSSIYYIFNIYIQNNAVFDSVNSIFDFILLIYNRNVTTSFWYLYLYISILITLPFLQRLVSTFDKNMYIIFISISILFLGTMPIILHYKPEYYYSIYINSDFFSTTFGLLITGHFINQYVKYNKKLVLIDCLIILSSIIIIPYLTYLEYLKNSSSYLFFENREFITVTAPAISTFYLVKCFCEKVNINKKYTIDIITHISKCTFCIYLLSDMFLNFLRPIFYNSDFVETANPLVAVLIFQVMLFIINLIASSIFLKIPYLNKII